MRRLSAWMFLSGCILPLQLSAPAGAEEAKKGPEPGWYIAAPEREGSPSLALKITKRGAVFGVSGIVGNPAKTKSQVPLGGTYYPSQNKLAATWTQTFRTFSNTVKKAKLPIDGKYDAEKDAFDVKVAFYTLHGPGRYSFHCVRSKTKEKATDLTGTWKVEDVGWTLRLTQKDDMVTGNYSGGTGDSQASGSITTKLTNNTLTGTYTHRRGGETYQGTVQATLTDQNTIQGVWKEKKSGFAQSVIAKRSG